MFDIVQINHTSFSESYLKSLFLSPLHYSIPPVAIGHKNCPESGASTKYFMGSTMSQFLINWFLPRFDHHTIGPLLVHAIKPGV